MAINPFMRAALKALSYPEILDKKNGYRLQRAAVNASHPHVLRPFYKIWDHHILASDHEVPVRVFSPEVERVFPMLLFFHGGGWVTGNIDSYDKVCTNMARLTRHIVVSVDYRLAPEHRFPAAPEDCYLAAREIFSQCHLFGITPDDITLIGDSAGGNLADNSTLEIAQKIKNRYHIEPKPGGGGLADGAGPRGIHAPPADFAVPGHQQRPHRKFPL